MAVNKYGNDFKNNIMWNKEYPFIPEITNDDGFTIHEDDIVEFYDPYDRKYYAARVCKIYDIRFIWTDFIDSEKHTCIRVLSANELFPHIHSCKPPRFENYDIKDNGFCNWLDIFLGSIYSSIYPEELNLPNDWHFDHIKFEAKRLEEVAKLKSKY